jgi:DNA-binding transcriptional ArsR family regulator
VFHETDHYPARRWRGQKLTTTTRPRSESSLWGPADGRWLLPTRSVVLRCGHARKLADDRDCQVGLGANDRIVDPFVALRDVGQSVSFGTDMLAGRVRGSLGLTAKLFRGLGDVSRLRVLAALRDGPLTAGEIVTRTGLSQPNASMHLKCLGECGLVTWERDGRFVHYEVADKRVVKLLDQGEELLLHIGPLIAACPRYRQPGREAQRRTRPRRRR